ncbi:RNaseH domain-containing protein [Streptomyces althioticus]|uniref:RNaseH domain-containing protein n=1 Tax=Streptomyces althioticus TaxID=83380 RepID=UPI0036FA9E8A
MATYDRLQRMALVLKPTDEEPLGAYYAYEFPQIWARELHKRVFQRARQSDDDEEWHGLPLWAVTSGITALLPHVLVGNSSGRQGKVWLAWNHQDGSPTPDGELIVELVRSGLVVAAMSKNEKARLRGRPEPIDVTELVSVMENFKGSDLRGGLRRLRIEKDRILRDAEYKVLPNLLAARLVSEDWQADHTGWEWDEAGTPTRLKKYGTSRWHRVAADEGAELISWPPYVYESKNETPYPWSYTLRLTAQNYALDPSSECLIHARVGIRRWARGNVWDGKRAITSYLFTPSPWATATSPFGKTRMRWQPGPKGKKEGKMVWDDVLADTLARYTSHHYLPSPSELAADPYAFFKPADGASPLAGVVFRDGLGQYAKHSVGKGVSARDRWQIFHQLAAALSAVAKPETPLRRIPVPVRPRPSADQLLSIDQPSLARAMPQGIAIDVLWNTTTMRDEALATLNTAFGQPVPQIRQDQAGPSRHEYVLETDGISVVVTTQPVGEIAGALQVDSTIKNRKDRIRQATTPRRATTVERLRPACPSSHQRFALIEMPDADAYNTAEHDPKQAVKAAAASIGVLAQNITPPKPTGTLPGQETVGTRRQRVAKSVMDLLVRQTGLLTHPSAPGTASSPLVDVTTVGFWVVRRNKESRALLPLAVSHAPDEPFARIRLPHNDAWMPIHQGLLTLADFDIERRLAHERIQEFFQEVTEEVCDGSDIALLTLAQNLRSSCPGLTNGNLTSDGLAFNAEAPIPADRRKGLRHIRLRTNVRDETSQHYSFTESGEEGDVGVGSALWADPHRPRHFFSTAKKPATAGNGSPKGSRLEAHWGCTGKDENKDKIYGMKHDTLQDVWNPALLEILVACHGPDDDPAPWAALVHQQRYEASHFSDPLALPAVLHLAHKVSEHILPHYLVEPITEYDG